MGRRSRKSGAAAPASGAPVRRTPPSVEQARAEDPATRYADRQARAEARNAEVRAKLEPLEPGEHPLPLRLAIGTCLLFALSNVALAASGYDLQSEDGETGSSSYVGVALFSVILLVNAAGMHRHRYWAVLGFQALLALTVLIAALSVVVASNVAALLLCLAMIAYGGWLFWAMIRVMARVQMPQVRRPRP